MKLLAYDTSSAVLTAAIFDGTKKIAEFESRSFERHSSVLVPSLEKLLKDHGMALSQIGVLAVGLGPGSFTGLRVGITTAKIFAYACQMKIVGVSSLEAMALRANSFQGEIASILDARKGMLYAGLYENRDKKFKVIQSPRLVKIDVLLKRVKKPRLFLGDGVKLYHERILKTDQCRIAETAESAYPRAADFAGRAMELAEKKQWIDPFSLEPVYLHPRDCNVTQPLASSSRPPKYRRVHRTGPPGSVAERRGWK